MRIVLDTNVFVSGVFFTGPPHVVGDVRAERAWNHLKKSERFIHQKVGHVQMHA